MLRVQVRFLAGRYHATPWGRHVNEGAVEWPPSPWRIARALIATGYTKLGWKPVPAEAVAALESLCARAPVFHLPPAGAGHTRHYMPLFKDKTTKVIDAFVHPGDQPMVIEWDGEFEPAHAALISALFERMSYLGRAESWIEAGRTDDVPDGLLVCPPIGHEEGAATADHDASGERVELLAPMTALDYLQWREHAFAREQDRRLTAKAAAAIAKGKKPPGKLSGKERAQLVAELPPSLVHALQVDTATLRKAGWSQPPGSRIVAYRRPGAAFDVSPPRRRSAGSQDVDTALLALVPDTVRARQLPPLRDAVARGEMLHGTLVKFSDIRGDGRPSPCFTGKGDDNEPLRGHRHATLIPLVLESRWSVPMHSTKIDHFAVHAPMGFDHRAIAALRRVRETYAKNHPGLFVTLAGLGRVEDDAFAEVPQLATARVWVSATPFVPPRHLKPRGPSGLAEQVRAELASRGLPRPTSVEVEIESPTGAESQRSFVDAGGFWDLWRRRSAAVRLCAPGENSAEVSSKAVGIKASASPIHALSKRWRRFRRARREVDKRPPAEAGFGLRLVFDREVPRGPISLGYASHFGLGSFVPQ